MIGRKRFDDPAIRAHLARQAGLPFSYPDVGRTRENAEPPRRYRLTGGRTELGHGKDCYARACTAVRAWKMFAMDWVELCWPDAPIEVGTTVGIVANAGLWTLSACRIVYVIDEPTRFGFGYGTLPDHMAKGEERFLVEITDDDRVCYDLHAFSRPGHLLTHLSRKGMQQSQARFGRDSARAMQKATSA